jgi:hypothetical protein
MAKTEAPIQVREDGTAFVNQEEAETALKQRELDPDVWTTLAHQDGYAIAKRAYCDKLAKEQAAKSNAKQKPAAGQKYFWVMFPMPSGLDQGAKVELTHNGVRLTYSRNEKVVISEAFRGVCDCAVQPIFLPKEDAKVDEPAYVRGGELHRRPYQLLGEASKADFDSMLKSGNLITRKSIMEAGGDPSRLTN